MSVGLTIAGESRYEQAVNEYLGQCLLNHNRAVTLRQVIGTHAGVGYTHYCESRLDRPFGVWQLLDAGQRLPDGHPQTMASAFCRDWTVLRKNSRVRHAYFRDIAFVKRSWQGADNPSPIPYKMAEMCFTQSGGMQTSGVYLRITAPADKSAQGLAWFLSCLLWHPVQRSPSQFVGLM